MRKPIVQFVMSKNKQSVEVRYKGSMKYWFMPKYEIVQLIKTQHSNRTKETLFGISIKFKEYLCIPTNIFWLN
jgi:hypothetical protein